MDKPLRILAPVSDHPAELSSLILPLLAGGPLEVTLFRVGDRGKLPEAAKIFQRRGLPARSVKGHGDPAREILVMAKAGRFDVVAMITHGRKGLRRALAGSVAEDVLRRSDVPVLLARPLSAKGPWPLVVASLDGSARAERILPCAGRLAKAAGTPLHLLRVHLPGEARMARDYLERTCRRLEAKGVVALPVARQGIGARGVVRYARDLEVGVVCLTTRGRTGLRRLLLGSTAEGVVRRAPCPVLVLRV